MSKSALCMSNHSRRGNGDNVSTGSDSNQKSDSRRSSTTHSSLPLYLYVRKYANVINHVIRVTPERQVKSRR